MTSSVASLATTASAARGSPSSSNLFSTLSAGPRLASEKRLSPTRSTRSKQPVWETSIRSPGFPASNRAARGEMAAGVDRVMAWSWTGARKRASAGNASTTHRYHPNRPLLALQVAVPIITDDSFFEMLGPTLSIALPSAGPCRGFALRGFNTRRPGLRGVAEVRYSRFARSALAPRSAVRPPIQAAAIATATRSSGST